MDQDSPQAEISPAPLQSVEPTGPRAEVSWRLRFVWAFAGVLLPTVCFVIGFPIQPSWQSGNVEDYAALLLSHEASLPLYPLLLGCMTSLSLLSAQPARFAKSRWVWLGIFSGVVLAVEYWLVFQATMGATGTGTWFPKRYLQTVPLSAIIIAVPWFGGRLLIYGLSLLPANGRMVVVAGLLVLMPVAFPYLAVLCLFCSTPWAVAAYGSAAVWLVRQRKAPYLRYTLAQLLAAVTWLAVNFAAWRTAYQVMLVKYASLPLTAPDCFVCSAAAKGHRSVVHSQTWLAEDGRTCVVNEQMRVLKAFELLIAALSPFAHRVLRGIYNRIGPRLAAGLANPAAADAAYFGLKPLEWLARGALHLVLGRQSALIARLYRV